jgi:hypothetical protein
VPVPFLRATLSHELRHHVTPLTSQPPCQQIFTQHTPASQLTLDELNQPLDRLGLTESAHRSAEDDDESPGGSSYTILRRSDRTRRGSAHNCRGNARRDAGAGEQWRDADAVLLDSSKLSTVLTSEELEKLPMWRRRQLRVLQQHAMAVQRAGKCGGRQLDGQRSGTSVSKHVGGPSARTRAAVALARDRSVPVEQDDAVPDGACKAGSGSAEQLSDAWPKKQACVENSARPDGTSVGTGPDAVTGALLSAGKNDLESGVGGKREAEAREARGGAGVRRRTLHATKRQSSSRSRIGSASSEGGAAETNAPEDGSKLVLDNVQVATGEADTCSQQEIAEPHGLPPQVNIACMLHNRECAFEGM